MKFIFQVETKSYWFLGLEDNSNRDCECVHTPPFKMNAFFYVEQLSPYKPRKTNNPGRRGKISKYRFGVL